jgi:deoxynucleoside triphosphate triphosphohydrolase SAMHD1
LIPAIEEKGLPALEDFVHSRFQMYLYVYFHKTVCGFKLLLGEAMQEGMAESICSARVKASLTDVAHFEHFTDSALWEVFRTVSQQRSGSSCDRLIKRQKLRWLEMKRNPARRDVKANESRLGSLVQGNIRVFESDVKFANLGKEYDRLRVIAKDRISGRRGHEAISSMTDFFSKFGKTRLVHFYEH